MCNKIEQVEVKVIVYVNYENGYGITNINKIYKERFILRPKKRESMKKKCFNPMHIYINLRVEYCKIVRAFIWWQMLIFPELCAR